MKRGIILVACLLAPTVFGDAVAGDNNSGWGLGVMLGEPTGFSAKHWSDATSALDFGLAWSTDSNSSVSLHADYIRHRFDMVEWDKGDVPFYYGIGARFRGRENGDDNIGIRFPLGLDYLFARSAFDAFFELVPIMDLAPDTDFDINIALGARYFF